MKNTSPILFAFFGVISALSPTHYIVRVNAIRAKCRPRAKKSAGAQLMRLSSRALLSPKNNNPQNRTTREVRLESEFPFEHGANPLAMCRSGCSKNLERILRAPTPRLGFFIKGENSLSLARSHSAPVKLEPTSLTERTLSTSIYTMRRDGLFHYSGHILIELGSACAPRRKFHLVERLGVERRGGLTNLS